MGREKNPPLLLGLSPSSFGRLVIQATALNRKIGFDKNCGHNCLILVQVQVIVTNIGFVWTVDQLMIRI